MKLLPLFLLLAVAARAAAPRQPNIIFIFSDDHAYQAVSAYGSGKLLPSITNRKPVGSASASGQRVVTTFARV